LRVLWYSVYMKKEINTIEQAKNLSTLEFMDLSPLERKLIDELKRVESQVELLQEWLDNSHRTSELLRNARDNYRRQLGISSDWDTMESVRDKYDARHGG
jgi:DNA gyrase/topoisomerase IV subunit A